MDCSTGVRTDTNTIHHGKRTHMDIHQSMFQNWKKMKRMRMKNKSNTTQKIDTSNIYLSSNNNTTISTLNSSIQHNKSSQFDDFTITTPHKVNFNIHHTSTLTHTTRINHSIQISFSFTIIIHYYRHTNSLHVLLKE